MAESTPAGQDTVYDVVVLGGGSGGYAAALRSAQLGQSVLLIEAGKLGGTCLHNGCIPTKALLHAAEVADAARDSENFGIHASFNGVDMAGVHKYKDGVINRMFSGLKGLIKARGITVVEGWGKLTSRNTVEVDGAQFQGKNIVLATGSYARSLPGLDIGGRIITSDQGLVMDTVPEKAIVLGGGVIGVEFASVWRSFGAEVTVVEALPNLVPNEDIAASKALERAFRKRGISFKTGVRFESAEQDDSKVTVTLEGGEKLDADVLLVAVGRGPTTSNLGYEEAGIEMDRGFVPTNDRLETSVPNVYAVGDIVPGLQLAHRGYSQGIFVAEEIAGLNPPTIIESGIPRVTYCSPEVASVGVTEKEAREIYGDEKVEVVDYNLAGNGKSAILATAGFVKLVREKDGPVVGIHMVGDRVGELIGESELIVGWEAYPEDVASLIHAHPTQGEALGEAHLALAGKPLHAM